MIRLQIIPTNNWLRDNGYTPEEEIYIYSKQLEDIYDNPRWYLDNLDYLREYRTYFINYNRKVCKHL